MMRNSNPARSRRHLRPGTATDRRRCPRHGVEPSLLRPSRRAGAARAAPRAATGASDVEEQAQQLVVMIRGTLAGESVIGAGAHLRRRRRTGIYVATANHVVRRGRGNRSADRSRSPKCSCIGCVASGPQHRCSKTSMRASIVAVMTVSRRARPPLESQLALRPRSGAGPCSGRTACLRRGVPRDRGRGNPTWQPGCDCQESMTSTTRRSRPNFVQQGHSGGGTRQ